MDLFGKQGEEAMERLEKVSGRLESLESHLDAVDTALQDFMDRSEALLEHTYRFEEAEVDSIDELEHEVEEEETEIETVERRVRNLEEDMKHLRRKEVDNARKIDRIMDSELLDIIDRVRKLINSTNRRYNRLRDSLESMEQRINELENDFVMEVNTRDYDFDKKVDESEFETEKDELWNEVKKLRASVNVLADELDKRNEVQTN